MTNDQISPLLGGGKDRVAIGLEGAHGDPLVKGHKEGLALELAGDEPAGGGGILGADDPAAQEVGAPPGEGDVGLSLDWGALQHFI